MKINANRIVLTSTTKHDMVNELYHNKELKYTIANICNANVQNEFRDDVTQELFLSIMEMPQDKFDKLLITKSVYYWCVKFLNLSITSKFSPFYYKYKRQRGKIINESQFIRDGVTHSFEGFAVDYESTASIDIIEKKVQPELDAYINSLHWYDRMIFQYYITEYNSIAKLSRYTEIPKSEIQKVIKRTKLSIQEFIIKKQLLDD